MALTSKHLRELADLLDKEEEGESSQAMQARIDALEAKLEGATPAQKQEALDRLSEDEVVELRKLLADRRPVPPDEEPTVEEVVAPAVKHRPGRKSGAAYDWDIDEDGNRVKLDHARVYGEDDEDDRVPVSEGASGW